MAYPIRLFDFSTDEGKTKGTEFLLNLDKTLVGLFGRTVPDEKLRKFHKYNTGELPEFIREVGEHAVKEVVKELPQGELKWKGTIGLYGRKTGSLIKKEKDLVYRMIINIGDTEIYYMTGEGNNGGLNNEPSVLPHGYALLCSPVMIDKVDFRVKPDPHRKNLPKKLVGLVPKIRMPKYMRCTIVLDLLMDGLELPSSESNDLESNDLESNGEKNDQTNDEKILEAVSDLTEEIENHE